jgi:hypothetical protein
MPAIEEINAKSPLYIEIIELKEGQAVKDVQFKVWLKSQFQQSPPVSSLHIQAASLGIPKEEITNHLKNGVSEADLRLELGKLSARKENGRLDPIQSPLAMFRANMRRIEPIPVKSRIINETKAKKLKQPSLFDATEPPTGEAATSTTAPSEVTAVDLVFEELARQSQETIDKVLDQVRKELAARNILTPVMSKRITEKNWRSGSLRAHAVDIFANQTYGPDWRQAIDQKIKSMNS